MEDINELYSKRLEGKNISSTEGLEDLIISDEKSFYFALMYFYYNKKDLGYMVRYSSVLVTAITLFCLTLKDTKVTEYFSNYLDLDEIPDQIRKIYNELRLVN